VAFNRVVEMKAGTSGGSIVISGLDMTFDITRSRQFSNNVAKFKIYNPKEDTISRALKLGNSISFKAGYEDEGLGLIYIGQITQSIPKREPPNVVVSIECGSIQNANTALGAVTLSMSYLSGTLLSRVIEEIATALGLNVVGLNYISNVRLTNGFYFAGTAKDAMRYCETVLNNYHLGLFIDNTTFTIAKRGEGNGILAVKLTPATGLIEAPSLIDNTDGGEAVQEALPRRALFKSILNYKIVPNGYVQIQNKDINSNFIVDKCHFVGDNFGGSFYVSGEGLGA
jgi:hypothetical protein